MTWDLCETPPSSFNIINCKFLSFTWCDWRQLQHVNLHLPLSTQVYMGTCTWALDTLSKCHECHRVMDMSALFFLPNNLQGLEQPPTGPSPIPLSWCLQGLLEWDAGVISTRPWIFVLTHVYYKAPAQQEQKVKIWPEDMWKSPHIHTQSVRLFSSPWSSTYTGRRRYKNPLLLLFMNFPPLFVLDPWDWWDVLVEDDSPDGRCLSGKYRG